MCNKKEKYKKKNLINNFENLNIDEYKHCNLVY